MSDGPTEIEKGFPIKDKYKANAPSDQTFHETTAFNSSTATALELTTKPNQIISIQADENCWISFGGVVSASKSVTTSIKIIKNLVYSFPLIGAAGKFISVIGDTASGNLGICYGVNNADNDMDADPNS
jgi:hypothetical protein